MSSTPASQSSALGADTCAFCKAQTRTHYRIGRSLACEACTHRIKEVLRTNPSKYYWRSLGVGIAAAVISSTGYAIFLIGAHISLGSFLLGIVISTAMMIASKGTGGLRYRFTAAILTYLAGSVPWGFIQLAHHAPVWLRLALGLASPFIRLAGGTGAILSAIALGASIVSAWMIAGGTPRPGIYGPFGSETRQ